MIELVLNGQLMLFGIILLALVFSLTFHEFGHAGMAKLLGDDTAQRAGRLTLNPVAHIDPLGLLMVVLVGFGYARPVPVNPQRFRYSWADGAVAFAGPAMNLAIAVVCVNLFVWVRQDSAVFEFQEALLTALLFLARINVLLMLFNLVPLGPLDGHHIMQSLLPRDLSVAYRAFNDRYGTGVFMVLILLSIGGVPIFAWLSDLSDRILPLLSFA